MMLLDPMRIGPPKANMNALGWTMVPGPMVISPLSSTSWQTSAFE